MDKNAQYDRELRIILERTLNPDSCCVDVGAHSGAFLDLFLQFAPRGRHYAFEPIPALCLSLTERHSGLSNVIINNSALSEKTGKSTFKHVISNPGYSGLLQRRFDRPHEKVADIVVNVTTLDEVIPKSENIHFVKIDVEGGEFGVLQGGIETLKRCLPFIAFEHGLGSADVYGTTPEMVFDLLTNQVGLEIFLMERWRCEPKLKALSRAQFADEFNSGRNFFFLAVPKWGLVRSD